MTMRKIIVGFDGQHFSHGAMKMAEWLNKKTPVQVYGIFISPVDYRDLLGYSGLGMGAPVMTVPFEGDDRMAEANIRTFVQYCEQHNLQYAVHKDTDMFAIEELILETRFADLLILSSELFYENIDKDQPNEYLKRVLHETECPVMLVPEQFSEPRSVLLSYDGKESSVFAIKQFAYLFPECCHMVSMLFHSNGIGIPQAVRMKELLDRHFPGTNMEQLNEEDSAALHEWMLEKKNTILVSGGFGRNELSSMFRKSYITDIIQAHRIPVFIAHR